MKIRNVANPDSELPSGPDEDRSSQQDCLPRPKPYCSRLRAGAIFGILASAAALTAGACSSTEEVRGVPVVGSTTIFNPPPSSASNIQPTVPDCGRNAYRPSVLHIECGSAGPTATGIHWDSWQPSRAAGIGLVQMQVGGQQRSSRADLVLSYPVNDGAGRPEFTQLTVSWLGASPDGRRADTFQLATGG